MWFNKSTNLSGILNSLPKAMLTQHNCGGTSQFRTCILIPYNLKNNSLLKTENRQQWKSLGETEAFVILGGDKWFVCLIIIKRKKGQSSKNQWMGVSICHCPRTKDNRKVKKQLKKQELKYVSIYDKAVEKHLRTEKHLIQTFRTECLTNRLPILKISTFLSKRKN